MTIDIQLPININYLFQKPIMMKKIWKTSLLKCEYQIALPQNDDCSRDKRANNVLGGSREYYISIIADEQKIHIQGNAWQL